MAFKSPAYLHSEQAYLFALFAEGFDEEYCEYLLVCAEVTESI